MLCKHEDQSSNAQHPVKKAMCGTKNLKHQWNEVKDTRITGVSWPPAVSRCTERPCLKRIASRMLKFHLVWPFLDSMHTHVYIHHKYTLDAHTNQKNKKSK